MSNYYIYYRFQNYMEGNGRKYMRPFAAGKDELDTLFSQHKLNQAIEESRKILEQKFNKLINENLNKANRGVSEEDKITREEYLKILSDFQIGVLNTAADKMSKNISYENLQTKKYAGDKNNLQNNANELQNIINALKEITNISSRNGKTIISNLAIQSILQAKKEGNEQEALKQLRTQFRESLNIPNKITIKGNRISSNEDFKKIVGNIRILESMEKRYRAGKLVDFDAESKIIQSTLNSTYYILRRVMGLVSEKELAKVAENTCNEVLKKYFSSYENVSVQAKQISTGTTDGYVNTADIKFSLSLNKPKADGTLAHFELDLPGASLKRTTLTGDNVTLKLKSGTNLNRFFSSKTFQMHAHHLGNFFGALPQMQDTYKKSFYQDNFFSMLKISMFPNAIAGTLNKDDFAYFFIVNNKIFSVLDMLNGLSGMELAQKIKIEGYTNLIKEGEAANEFIEQKEKESISSLATKRSKTTFDAIKKIKFNIALNWKLS